MTGLADDIRKWQRLVGDVRALRAEMTEGRLECRRCLGHGRIIMAAHGALDALPRAHETFQQLLPGRVVEFSDYAPVGAVYDVVCPECGLDRLIP